MDVLVTSSVDDTTEYVVLEGSQHIRCYPAPPCTETAVLVTLLRQTPTLCDAERNERYCSEIKRNLNPKQKPKLETNKLTVTATLSHQHIICSSISRLIHRHNITTIHIPKRKAMHMLRSVKDERHLNVSGGSSKQQTNGTKYAAGNWLRSVGHFEMDCVI